MEVFVAFSMDEEVPLLEQTLNAWAECDWAHIAMIQVPAGGKFEIRRRVLADNLAQRTFYILADLGCVPDKMAHPKIPNDKDGLVGFTNTICDYGCICSGVLPHPHCEAHAVPHGVRICKKGVIGKWPMKTTNLYDQEHANAVRFHGHQVSICRDTTYKRLQES